MATFFRDYSFVTTDPLINCEGPLNHGIAELRHKVRRPCWSSLYVVGPHAAHHAFSWNLLVVVADPWRLYWGWDVTGRFFFRNRQGRCLFSILLAIFTSLVWGGSERSKKSFVLTTKSSADITWHHLQWVYIDLFFMSIHWPCILIMYNNWLILHFNYNLKYLESLYCPVATSPTQHPPNIPQVSEDNKRSLKFNVLVVRICTLDFLGFRCLILPGTQQKYRGYKGNKHDIRKTSWKRILHPHDKTKSCNNHVQ